MSDCPFCARIGAGQCESFSEDPSVVWFEPLNPVTPGHMLFVPVGHVEDALASPYVSALTMEIASRWQAQHWGRAGQRDCNLITSVGVDATQTVRHLHIHLVPRRAGDGLHLPWTAQKRLTTEPSEVADGPLRRALWGVGWLAEWERARAAEDADRAWIDGIRRRLRLVTVEDGIPAPAADDPPWPALPRGATVQLLMAGRIEWLDPRYVGRIRRDGE